MQTQSPKKKNTALIVVGVIGGSCLLLVAAVALLLTSLRRLASKVISMDPTVAAGVAHQIVDYDLPAGYGEQMAVTLPSYQIVMISPVGSSVGLVITLAQFAGSENMSPEEMERQLSQSYDQPGASPAGQMRVVETKAVTIRGYETEAIIREGSLETGVVVRQLVAVFPGKSSQAMLMIQGTTDLWDEQMVDDFIESIR